MKLKSSSIVLCLIPLFASAEAKESKPRIVNDPIAAYYRDQIVAQSLQANAMVVEADFDCDGQKDLAITNSTETGKSGAWWFIYLHRSDGRFTEIGSVGTKANRFHITTRKNGLGRLAVMLRSGPGNFLITFYDVSQTGLKKVSEEVVRLKEEDTGTNRIEEVFGESYSELPVTSHAFSGLQANLGK